MLIKTKRILNGHWVTLPLRNLILRLRIPEVLASIIVCAIYIRKLFLSLRSMYVMYFHFQFFFAPGKEKTQDKEETQGRFCQ